MDDGEVLWEHEWRECSRKNDARTPFVLSKETAERRFWLDGDLGADGNEVPAGVYSRGNHKGPIRFEQEMIGWEEVFMIELMGPLMLPGRIS